MRSMHAKFHEFSMHRSAYMNLSLLYFFDFFTLEEQELGIISNMKDLAPYEVVPTKFVSSFWSSILFSMNFQILHD
jgi:hypothetical protein